MDKVKYIVFLTILVSFNVFAASQTFSGLGTSDSGGSGFKTITNISGIVVSNNLNHTGTEIYGSENGVGATEVLVLKADGINAESFTFNDLQVFNFTGSSTWTTSTIEFKDKTGADIQVMSNPNALTTSTVSIGTLYTSNNSLPIVGVAEIRINLSGGGSPSNFTLASIDTSNFVAPASSDNSGTLVAAGVVSEPINLPSTSQVASPLPVFDFQINDGGAGDGLSLDISQINISLSGTASVNFSKLRFNLAGCASKSAVQQSASVVSFTGLSISITEGGSTTCTVEAYWADNTGLTDNQTLAFSIDGDTDLTLDGSKTQMTGTNVAVSTGNMTTSITATKLIFTTQPVGSISGAVLTTQPVITAQDAAGNTDIDFTELVTLSEASAGTLSGDIDINAVSGVATFTNIVYNASADQQSFTLSADDESGVADDLPVSTANAITSDVVATKLIFSTQPAPLAIPSDTLTNFTTVPVVQAVDANNIVDTGYPNSIELSEANGLGGAILTGTTDTDGNSATVTMNATAGSATFSGLKINYSLSGAGPEAFNLFAASGALTSSQSSQLIASNTTPPSIMSIAVSGSPNAASSSVSFVVNFDKNVNNISTDDFALSSTNTAAGTISSVSASSGTSITVTVNAISGAGTLRLDLKGNTNITDDNGNGNGSNGFVAAYTSGSSQNVDRVGPTITAITIADNAHKVGDVVTATITVVSDTDDYTSGSGGLTTSNINGYSLGNLTKVNDTTYTALFTIINGGTDIASGSDVPVSVTLNDTLGNTGNTYTTALSQANDAIYANSPVINLSTDKTAIAENAGVAVLTATISGSLNNNWPDDIDVNLSYSGTAANPADYSRAAKIVISANNSTGAANITAIADSHFDAAVDETVVVDISTLSVGSIGTTSQQTITINDEQSAPTVSLSVDNTSINENAGNADVTATLSNATFAPVTVSLLYSGTATAGVDFNNTVSSVITIAANTLSNSVDTAISGIDDAIEEGSETIVVDIGTVAGGSASENGVQQLTVTMIDDDDTTPPVIANVLVPLAKTYKVGENLDFTVNTDEVTLVNTAGGSPRLKLTIGTTTKYASYVSGSNSQALLFRYTVEAELFDDNGITLTSFDINGATVKDTAGNNLNSALNGVGTLAAVHVDSVSPKVTSVTSSTDNGTYNAGSTVNVQVVFDKNVIVATTSGTPSINLNASSAAQAVYSAGSNSNTLVFNYTVQAGDNITDLGVTNIASLALNSASIKDALGNDATVTLPAPGAVNSLSHNKDITIDTLAPVVPVITSPLSPTLVNSAFATISGTHSENAVNVHVYQDANQDGQPDNTTSLASGEVLAGTWTLNVPVNSGTNSFVVKAIDAATNTSSAVTVALITRNLAPQISGTPNTSVSTGSNYRFTPSASDVDGDSITFSIANQPNWASFNPVTGELSGVPTRANVGVFSNITISVSDGALSAALPAFNIEVLNVNDAPTITGSPVTSVDEGKAYSFTPIASDVDGDNLTFSITNKPSWATFNTSSGTLSGIPSASDIGITSGIIISVSDGALSAALPAFNIEVLDVNDAPTISGSPVTSVGEGKAYSFTPIASDVDGDTLTFSITNKPSWATFNTSSGTLSGIPSASDIGITSGISISVSDGALSAALPAFNIEVLDVNDAPTISGSPVTSVGEGKAYSFTPIASDVDGDTLTFSITNKPSWATFNTSSGTLSGIPSASDIGITSGISISVSDGALSAALPAFNIEVLDVNDAPTISGSPGTSVGEGKAYSFTPIASDVDGDTLIFSIVNKPSWATFNTSSGTLSGIPSASDIGITSGISISVSDGVLSTSLPAFNIEVLDVNDAPTISGSPGTSVDEGKAYSFTPIASDVDGDTLIFSIVNKPSWATFNTSSGTLSGIPSASDIGITSGISISVSDGVLSTSLPAFNIEVLDVNDAPTISGSPVTSVGEGKAYSFTPIASDVDGDTLTFSIVNKPSWATFNTSSGTLSGIPSASDIGITSGISISVSDGVLSTSLPAFNIEVLNVNEAPVLEGQNVSVDEDSSLTISLNAQDADNDELTFEVTSEPLFGKVSMVGSSVVYTPNADYFGQDQFSVIANDGELASEPAVIIIDIKPVNDAPIAADDAFTQPYSETMLYTLDVLTNDSDVDGDVLRVMAVSADIGAVNIVDNQLMYQAIMGGPEQVNLSYTLVDQGEAVAKANVVLTITDQVTEQLPIINVPNTVSVNATGLYTKVNIGIATAQDTDGNPLAVSLVNNRVLFEPGEHTVYWYAEDSEGRSRVAAQQVNVNPLISIDKDTTIAEGGEYTTELYLNGDAVSYPLIVEYTVSGSADGNDHDLLAGEVTFNSRHASIHFTSFEDDYVEGDETLVISLIGEHYFAENTVQTITISEANIAPTVDLVTMQGEQMQAIVSKQNGEVSIKAGVTDANSLDVVTLSWQSELTNTSSEEHIFSFDPAVLSVGIYKISAIATDNGATPRSTMRSAYIEVREELTQLDEQSDSDGDLIPDTQEGYKDADLDGIPDYLDAIADCNVIQQRVDQQAHFLIEGEAGICIRKGSTVSNNQSGGVLLFSHELVTDDDAIHQGGIVDFIVEGLKEFGQSYQLVFPQHEAVPENAIYRKLINGQWQDFVIDDNNQIHSTSGEFGFCPAPGDGSWTPGLTAGHWCVQVTIEDGGQNDADGQVNGTIVDPSGVAVMNTQNNRPQAQSDSVAMPWNSTLVIDVLANDSDADGDTLTINSVTTDFGSVMIADNQLHYTAPIDFYGVAVIRYSISDGQGGSANSTVTVTVNANFAPSAMDDSAETDDATAINIAVLVNDSDPDGDALTVTSANVDSGSVVINADNTLTFTPQTGSATTATIDYAISDGRYTASAKVTVTVTKAQTPPPPEPSEPVSKKSSGAFTFALLLLLISAAIMRRRFKN